MRDVVLIEYDFWSRIVNDGLILGIKFFSKPENIPFVIQGHNKSFGNTSIPLCTKKYF